MDKKVTGKDVAQAAGVSVATVSYIMNNRSDQKISEETRKKVLQIANLLNYKPSPVAKSLATGRHSTIGIAYNLNTATPSRNLEIMGFANMLIERLNRLSYDVIFMPIPAASESLINKTIDGIIAIDLSNKDFTHLADNCFVPVISIDMLINDNLFYQIYADIPHLIKRATQHFNQDFYFVLEPHENEAYLEFITKNIPKDRIVFYSAQNLEELEKLKDKKILVLGAYLALVLRAYIADKNMVVIASHKTEAILPQDILVFKNDVSKKANLAISILLNAMDRIFDVKHDHMIDTTLE